MVYQLKVANSEVLIILIETVRMSSEGNDLHANCEGTSADLLRMADMLEKNPGLIDRLAVDTNITFCGEMTPLQSAVHRRHVECVQFLIERGANVDARNSRGYTALYIAVFGNKPELVQLLLEHGADPNYDISCKQEPNTTASRCTGSLFKSYFNLACGFGFADIMEILLSHGARVEELLDSPFSPLICSAAHKSVHIKRPDCLLLVLRNGAKVNYRQLPPEYHTQGNKKMASLMHYSITPAYSSPDCVEKMARIWTILREFGDDFYFEDEEGLTPLQRLRATYMPYNLNEALERILVEIMSQPLSLQSLCRIRIRRCMGVDCHKRLHMLTNIPRDIRAYLNYDKFEQTLDTIQFQK